MSPHAPNDGHSCLAYLCVFALELRIHAVPRFTNSHTSCGNDFPLADFMITSWIVLKIAKLSLASLSAFAMHAHQHEAKG